MALVTDRPSDVADAAPDENLFARFAKAAEARPGGIFIRQSGQPDLLYRDMLRESAKAAAWLRGLGIGRSDRIVVQVVKSVPAVILYLASLRVGAVFVPLNSAYGESEIYYFLGDVEPRLVVASRGCAAAQVGFAGHRILLDRQIEAAPWANAVPSAPIEQARASDPAAILYTSGTTGESKGAILTHGNLSSNAATLARAWRWREDDVLLHALPVFHVHGLFVALHCALLGASPMIFHESFQVDRVIADLPAATVFMGVPTYYSRLLEDPRLDAPLCSHMRLFVSGSAPLREATFDEFRKRTGHEILERYGMTEALMVTSNPYDGPRIAGSVGPPLPGILVRVMRDDGTEAAAGEPGVLHIQGPNLFAGYWRNPEKTAEDHAGDGSFISGDIATIDTAGVVRIVGRAKDLIISGGYNVYPKEIELVIDAEDGVAESAVIGVPHPDFGEAVVAIVVASPQGMNVQALRAAIAAKLADFKRPKAIRIVSGLPRNAMGKVQKAELRRQYADLFTAQRQGDQAWPTANP